MRSGAGACRIASGSLKASSICCASRASLISPAAEIYATLLDEGVQRCSIRTLYRPLAARDEVREHRNRLRHPLYRKPELPAQGSHPVWSWDIAKLMRPVKWTYFHLYVILDIFSRRVVGWRIADAETAAIQAPVRRRRRQA